MSGQWQSNRGPNLELTRRRAHYLGYSSDICRSFFIDPQTVGSSWFVRMARAAGLVRACPKESHVPDSLRAEKLKVWDIVMEAQTAAARTFTPNHTAADVDLAARGVIEDAGYGYGFTHRLGHGIGIKGRSPQFQVPWGPVAT